MLESFLTRAVLAGLMVAVAAAPLGCFVVWRRMAYFGDATAHAAMLGVALSLSLSLSIFPGTLLVAMLMAWLVSVLSGRGYAMDTVLGVLAHSSLAFGLVAVSFLDSVRIDLEAYLFGDILAVAAGDLVVMGAGALLVVLLLYRRWPALLLATVNSDLAAASGIAPEREQLVLTLSLALVVAVAIKVVGVLLITAMLIIPAAAARPLSASPERMVCVALLIGILSVLAGIGVSYHADTPAGPTIVCMASLVFVCTSTLSLLSGRRR